VGETKTNRDQAQVSSVKAHHKQAPLVVWIVTLNRVTIHLQLRASRLVKVQLKVLGIHLPHLTLFLAVVSLWVKLIQGKRDLLMILHKFHSIPWEGVTPRVLLSDKI
jgi:hypothetical protein